MSIICATEQTIVDIIVIPVIATVPVMVTNTVTKKGIKAIRKMESTMMLVGTMDEVTMTAEAMIEEIETPEEEVEGGISYKVDS